MSEEELNQTGEEMKAETGQQQGQEQEQNTRPVHPFDSMFFGNRNRQNRNDRQNRSQPATNDSPQMDGWLNSILNNKHLSNVNMDELMTHVDQLIVSLNELKPMFKKVAPMIQSFIQKEKE
ncbi:hypothetical protein AN964_16775 [Heyndrickxia shackletonii]|uniref:Uncharacterized protein n=1 Tax=Heyndrickxia shackletonii TaxID=157838 RepID=A0A0Q3TMM9_9BACI|nr:hypothetical protein [Heyndrickxia shackletonii]KQL54993.1 hypothetical protein AN964_16775 [Heyndrickxia shackletonii]NEZ01506.1 hypothetical protein [Heyndrickxia shackletonii]